MRPLFLFSLTGIKSPLRLRVVPYSSTPQIYASARNQELIDYQSQIRKMRKEMIIPRIGTPTKSQLAELGKAQARAARDAEWHAYLGDFKDKLAKTAAAQERGKACISGRSIWNRKKTMTAEERTAHQQQAEVNRRLAAAPRIEARRKSIAVLAEAAADFVTSENLDAKIQHAIQHPTNFNLSVSRMVENELEIRDRVCRTKVDMSDILPQAGCIQGKDS